MSNSALVTVDYLEQTRAVRTKYVDVNLGQSLSSIQKTRLNNGIFDGFPIGGYWQPSGGPKYRIVDYNYYLGTGGSGGLAVPHLVIVPDEPFATAESMYANGSGQLYGYAWSDMELGTDGYGLTAARSAISAVFGDANVLSHRQLFSNYISNNKVSSTIWVNSKVSLMSEINVFGNRHTSAPNLSITGAATLDTQQYAAFFLNPGLIPTKRNGSQVNCWLRDVVDAHLFSAIGMYGNPTVLGASAHAFVRPYFLLGGATT